MIFVFVYKMTLAWACANSRMGKTHLPASFSFGITTVLLHAVILEKNPIYHSKKPLLKMGF